MILRFAVTAILLVALTGCTPDEQSAEYPNRPIEIVVPFGAGGGSDTFVRVIQKAIQDNDLLPQPLVVINVPGAGGTIGSRRVKHAKADGYTVLNLHDAILTAKYSGKANYGPEAFTPIAGTGEACQVIAVSEDSRYQSLDELLKHAADEPDTVVLGANIGAPSYFTGLMMEHAHQGARFRYTQSGGGAKRFGSLKGGHIAVSTFSISEYMQFKSSGLRALAYTGLEPHPAIPGVPTAIECGYPIVNSTTQFWWMPKGVKPEYAARFAKALRDAMETDYVKGKLGELHITPIFLEGDDLDAALVAREAEIAKVDIRKTDSLPDLPTLTMIVLAVVAIFAGVEAFKSAPQVTNQASTPDYSRLVKSVAATLAYLLLLQAVVLDFRLTTFAFIFTMCLVVGGVTRRNLVHAGILGAVMAIGLHFVFTAVFSVDLPSA